ncbi:hypothetical protein [Robertkochia solimangrovi]|uniref:hypothetical protein n=1 Tax=Robertkochia solimangrovi TaxID=2213046 RepID=UPI00117E7717|nr:hypothetical protein [Robertkochia solimangrovi]
MKYILTAMVILFCFSGQAQESKRDKIRAMKVAFITEKLELSSAEAEKFWPVHNKYDDLLFQLKVREHGKLMRDLRKSGLSGITDQESREISKQLKTLETKIFETEQAYYDNVEKVLSSKKAIYLRVLEEDFKRELYRQLKEMHRKKE